MIELPPFLEKKKIANSACHLFILWLLNCICLSFPLCWGLNVDLIVSVPQFTYLLIFACFVHKKGELAFFVSPVC